MPIRIAINGFGRIGPNVLRTNTEQVRFLADTAANTETLNTRQTLFDMMLRPAPTHVPLGASG